MIKFFHLIFALLTISAFVAKFYLSEARSELLQQKAVKIAPHVISSLLLLSGIVLASQGYGLANGHGWLAVKLVAVVGFIGLGILTMRFEGQKRWLAFAGAIACFLYVCIVAATKNPLLFL
jgi:uncharacterized membrane protein SirB2